MLRRHLCWLILGVLLAPQLLAGTVYYVATSGDDAYNGLFPSAQGGVNGPFRTLRHAAAAVHAGDTVRIRAGIYQEASNWSTSGTQAQPIAITNYNGETVVIDGNGHTIPGGAYSVLLSVKGDWISVSNLEIRYSSWYGLMVNGAHCTVGNVYSHHQWGSGITMTGSYGLIENCRVYNNSLQNEYFQPHSPGTWSSGIAVCRAPSYVTVRNCTAWDNWGQGIDTYECTHVTVEDCVSYNNQQNFYISDAKFILFQRNLAYCTPGNMIQGYTTQNNILMGDERFNPPSSDNTVINNLCLGGERNIFCGKNVLENCLIANNTFVNASSTAGSESAGISINPGTYSNARILNNIILQEGGTKIAANGASGIIFGDNNWSKTPPSNCQGAGDVIAEPLLARIGPTGPGQLTPGWFKILDNSPARDQARVLGAVIEDFFRTPRGGQPDIGAHEIPGGASPLAVSATGSPTMGPAPLMVSFTGSASGGTSPYSYSWNFGDGGSSTSQSPSHTYLSIGSYTAILTVTDVAAATAESTVDIAVSGNAPLSVSVSAAPMSGPAPLVVNFTGNANGGAPPYSYSWTFGDDGSASSQNPSHTYTTAGNYVATLTVTDSGSSSASDSADIAVSTEGTTASLTLAMQTGAPSPGEGGSTDPAPGTYTFAIGSAARANSIPIKDYRFSRWEGDPPASSMFDTEVTVVMDHDKSLTSTFCTKCADVTGDLKVTPADAQRAFDIYLKKIANPTWCEWENADVNSSGTQLEPEVTPADAQLIFRKYLKKGSGTSSCSGNDRMAAAALESPAPAAVKLALSNPGLDPSGDVSIPVFVESSAAIGAFGFDLVFPSDQLTFVGLERTAMTAAFSRVEARVIPYSGPTDMPRREPGTAANAGLLRVGGFKAEPSTGPSSGVLITLIFRVTGDVGSSSPVSIIAAYDDIRNAFLPDRVLPSKTKRVGERPRPLIPERGSTGKAQER
jgi:PKD repeat protein